MQFWLYKQCVHFCQTFALRHELQVRRTVLRAQGSSRPRAAGGGGLRMRCGVVVFRRLHSKPSVCAVVTGFSQLMPGVTLSADLLVKNFCWLNWNKFDCIGTT